jgi:hypothetical protein
MTLSMRASGVSPGLGKMGGRIRMVTSVRRGKCLKNLSVPITAIGTMGQPASRARRAEPVFATPNPLPLERVPSGNMPRGLSMSKDICSVAKRPFILLATVHRESAQFTIGNFQYRDLEETGFSHEKDRARQAELHGQYIKIGDMVRCQHNGSIQREILQALHTQIHDQFEYRTKYKNGKLPKRGCMEHESRFIAGIKKYDFCQDDISQCWDYT